MGKEKEKDPAFLFYSKDWLEGTAEMTPEEKGVYIDLLAHQHQKGSLPIESKRLAKLVGLGEIEFLRIWADLSTKFLPNGTGRLVNRKLTEVTAERKEKGWRNTIIGTFAEVVWYSHVSRQMSEKAKKTFNVDDFISCDSRKLTECSTEWYNKRLKSIEDEDANEDGTEDKDYLESRYSKVSNGGYGPMSLVGGMMDIWVKKFPAYTPQKENDGYALRAIATFIFDNAGISNGFGDTNNEIKALNTFQTIADQVSKEPFWVNKPLKRISNN